MSLAGKSILITGGTGSFGRKFIEEALKNHKPKKLIVFSRDELKQYEMGQTYKDKCMRYFLGDVRDVERLRQAFEGVDIVIHAAALKQVPAAEYNPFEAIKTNILGAQNIITAALERKVKRVVALSTDKAVNPINLYGATKLCSDKLFVAGNSYSGKDKTLFGVVRYGNVVGSRGSVVPLFKEQRKTGVLTVTDQRMTRFWITLDQGVALVLKALKVMRGGEIFVPKIPSTNIMDLARSMGPDCKVKVTGIRPGEKLHEVLIPLDEARRTLEFKDMYVIEPDFPWWGESVLPGGRRCKENFEYRSDNNAQFLNTAQMKKMIG